MKGTFFLQSMKAGGSAKSRVAKELMRTMGLKTDQTQVTAGRPDGSTPADNQHTIPEELYRPLINMFVGKTEEEQEKIRSTFKQIGIDANNETLGLAMNSIEDLAGMSEDPRVRTAEKDSSPKAKNKIKKGQLNRAGSFKRILLKKMYDAGMIDVEQMRNYNTSTRKGNATDNSLDDLAAMLGTTRAKLGESSNSLFDLL